jgi:SAM-dependent methyltransferase
VIDPDADVPSPIDFRDPAHAREWASKAMVLRPWRTEIFARIAGELAVSGAMRVLELGSGPGWLAERVLAERPEIDYVALDFSPVMHELARDRIGERARFVVRDFLAADWADGLGRFDAVVTMQAVHELRHKRRAVALHAQVRALTARYLVCDHARAGSSLYMTTDEQVRALRDAGFATITELAAWPARDGRDAMVLYGAIA